MNYADIWGVDSCLLLARLLQILYIWKQLEAALMAAGLGPLIKGVKLQRNRKCYSRSADTKWGTAEELKNGLTYVFVFNELHFCSDNCLLLLLRHGPVVLANYYRTRGQQGCAVTQVRRRRKGRKWQKNVLLWETRSWWRRPDWD